MGGCKLFRRGGQGRRGGGVALCVREGFAGLEPNDGDNGVECLWVRIRGKANKADIMAESVMDHQTRMKRQMNYAISRWEKSHSC